ncbi:MAG TPA: hypothetical protein ENI63_01490 [Candidatus Kaiserbacteria bacterium]|nr:hypothetical protein [Candidatus Kaiserbacteria bacterium]
MALKQEQTIGTATFELDEMFRFLKEHFNVTTTEDIFISSYCDYYEKRSNEEGLNEIKKFIETDLANSNRSGKLPWYVMRVYQISSGQEVEQPYPAVL